MILYVEIFANIKRWTLQFLDFHQSVKVIEWNENDEKFFKKFYLR